MGRFQNKAFLSNAPRSTPVILLFLCILYHIDLVAAPIADGCDKFLGNISTAGPPSNFMNYWNQVTLENNTKWANVEPQRDQYNWQPVQAAYDYCQKNGIPFKYHTYLWNEQYPSWIDGLSSTDKKAEVEELIKLVGQKFPETAFIDVVNECRDKSPKWKDALGGAGATGYDWIVWAFETTRKYSPKAKLLINEYYCEKSLEYVTQYLKIINVLKQKNLIDGIGLQTHDGETKEGFQKGVLKQCLDSLATSGIPLYSTEFDMSGSDDEQLKFYQDIFPVIWEHPAMYGVTLWGWTDSWLLQLNPPKDARLIINNQERPALKWLRTYVTDHKSTIGKTPVYHIAPPSESSPRISVAGGFLQMHTTDAQTLALRVLDPAGRVVYSVPRKSYTPGMHTLLIPQSATGCRLLIVQSDTPASARKVLGRL